MFKKHTTDPDYGGDSLKWVPNISNIINYSQVDEVLDYGSGKGEMGRNLVLDRKVKVHLYDPGIPELDVLPEPCQMVVCVNVLDCVEDEYIDNVLDDLQRCTVYLNFIVIKEDKPMEFWLPKIMERFSIQSLVRTDGEFFVISNSLQAT